MYLNMYLLYIHILYIYLLYIIHYDFVNIREIEKCIIFIN